MHNKKNLQTTVQTKGSSRSKLSPSILKNEKPPLKNKSLKGTAKVNANVTLGCELVEEALNESNERYHSLFNSIDEGFCIIEVFFKKNGTAYDHRILEANAAFTTHTGVKDPIGKMASDLVPGGEQYFNDIYGQVVTTGKSKRFDQGSEVMVDGSLFLYLEWAMQQKIQ